MNKSASEAGEEIIKKYKQSCPATISWDDFMGICNGDDDKPAAPSDPDYDSVKWNGYLVQRNSYKTTINNYYKNNNKPFLLFNEEYGESIVLRYRDDATQNERFRLYEMLGKRTDMAIKVLRKIKDMKELTPSERKNLDTSSNLWEAVGLSLISIAQKTPLEKGMKTRLLTYLKETFMPDED